MRCGVVQCSALVRRLKRDKPRRTLVETFESPGAAMETEFELEMGGGSSLRGKLSSRNFSKSYARLQRYLLSKGKLKPD